MLSAMWSTFSLSTYESVGCELMNHQQKTCLASTSTVSVPRLRLSRSWDEGLATQWIGSVETIVMMTLTIQ